MKLPSRGVRQESDELERRRPRWARDNSGVRCTRCKTPFWLLCRRHHCRRCGKLFCNECSNIFMPLPHMGYPGAVRVCKPCRNRGGVQCVPAIDTSGVTVAVLKRLLCHSRFRGDMTTAKVCEEIVKPDTALLWCSFADMIRIQENGSEEAHGGVVKGKVHPKAGVFLSHPWGGKFTELVASVEAYLDEFPELDPSSTFFWLDVLVRNQHCSADGSGPRALAAGLEACLATTRRVAAVLVPGKPVPFTSRAWCLWEVWCAVSMGCQVDVVMPRTEHARFVQALCENFDEAATGLTSTSMDRAKSSRPGDRAAILGSLRALQGGVEAANELLDNFLCDWLHRTAHAELFKKNARSDSTRCWEDSAALLSGLGRLSFQRGSLEDALALLRRALAMYQSALGHEHPLVAVTYNQIATVYHAQGRWADALRLLELSLATVQRTLGQQDLRVATTLNKLALVHEARGELELAISRLERSLEITQCALGESDPDVAQIVKRLSALYQQQGDFEAAERACERTLGFCEDTLGWDHPDVVTALCDLGTNRELQGNDGGAQQAFAHALIVQESALGEWHPDLVDTLLAVARVSRKRGDFHNALRAYDRARRVLEHTGRPDHHRTSRILRHTAAVHVLAGNYERALSTLGDFADELVAQGSPEVFGVLGCVAVLHRVTGNLDKAATVLERSARMQRSSGEWGQKQQQRAVLEELHRATTGAVDNEHAPTLLSHVLLDDLGELGTKRD